jgi:ankyrin repeat protein
MRFQERTASDELPTRIVVRECAMALDGGTIHLGATDEAGRQVSIMLATSLPSSSMRVAGRLYFDGGLVPMRSEREARILNLLLEATVEAPRLPPSVPTSRMVIIGADIKEFLEQTPEENCRAFIRKIVESVQSECYLRLATDEERGHQARKNGVPGVEVGNSEPSAALDRAGITVFRDTTFLAGRPASERSRSLASDFLGVFSPPMSKKRVAIVSSVAVCAIVVGIYFVWIAFTFVDGGWYANSSSLHHFVARGETKQVEKMLRWNPRLAEERDIPFSQRRALHIACDSEQFGSVQILIRHGASVHARDSWGETPLHTAAAKANAPIVQFLIDNGADLNARDNNGCVPLHSATWATDVIKSFRRGAPPNAGFAGTLECVKALLPRGADPNVAGESGVTPLHAAASRGNQAVVEYLVSRGANVNAVIQLKQPWTPVMNAVNSEHFETARFLRRNGATLDFVSAAALGEEKYFRKELPGTDKETKYYAVLAACQSGEAHIVSLLLDDGVPVEGIKVWEYSVSPLHHASRRNKENVARLLIKRGADVNARNRDGQGPLYEAVYHGHHQMVRLLLDNGANINQADNHGETVLHYAAAPVEEDLEMVELLLKSGADPNARTKYGSTPLNRAVNRTEIENMLRRFGAK